MIIFVMIYFIYAFLLSENSGPPKVSIYRMLLNSKVTTFRVYFGNLTVSQQKQEKLLTAFN